MKQEEWGYCWDRLSGLWPEWAKKLTEHQASAIAEQLIRYEYTATWDAIGKLWETGEYKFEPDRKALVKLIYENQLKYLSPEEKGWRAKFQSWDKVKQNDYLAWYHMQMASRAEDAIERERNRSIARTASDTAKRLRRVNQKLDPKLAISDEELEKLLGGKITIVENQD